jgi:hypothetical protein
LGAIAAVAGRADAGLQLKPFLFIPQDFLLIVVASRHGKQLLHGEVTEDIALLSS